MKFTGKTITNPALIIPLVIFIVAKLFALFIASQGNCFAGFGPDCWVRWDSALYMEVAEKGHTLFYCGPEQGYPTVSSTDWCGNAGWAPLYPLFMLLMSKISGLSLAWAGIVLSSVFFIAYLLVAARLANINNFGIRHWLMMAILAFCPGNIYFHAVFPLSLVALLIAMFFYFLKTNKFLAAGMVGFLAMLSYSIGFFLLAALGLYGLYLLFTNKKQFVQFALKTGIPTFCGLLALFVFDHFSTGHWNALFMLQAKYGHGLHSPLKLFGERMSRLFTQPYSLKSWIEIQNLIMVMYVLVVVVYIIKNKALGAFRVFHALFMLIFWFLTYSASLDVALYRNAAVLGPGHSALKPLPAWVLGLVTVVFIVLSYYLGILFIQSTIV